MYQKKSLLTLDFYIELTYLQVQTILFFFEELSPLSVVFFFLLLL